MAAPAVQAQGTKILPADTELVVTVNLQQILKSEVFKANKTLVDIAKAKITEVLDDKEVGKYLKKANFDIFKDLSSVTVGYPAGRAENEAFLLLQGNFDSEKIEGAIMEASKEAGAGVKVKNVLFEEGRAVGVRAEVSDGWERDLRAKVIVDATGRRCLLANQLGMKHKDPNFNQFVISSWFRGVKQPPKRYEGFTLFYFLGLNQGWTWHIPLRNGITSMGVDGEP